MGFLSPKKNGWRVFTGMRSWVIQLKPCSFFSCLVQKENNEKMAQTLHFMFRHLIQNENIPLKLPVLEKWMKPLRDVPLSWIRRLHTEQTAIQACFFPHRKHQTTNHVKPVVYSLFSCIFFVILPYVCFCHLFLLLSLDQRFGPSRIVEGTAAPTRSERGSALALSQLTPSGESFDLCSASKQKNKMIKNGNWWSRTRGITFKIIKIWRRIYFPSSRFQRIAACIPRVKSYTSNVLKHCPTEGDRLWCLTMTARDLQNAARWKFATANLWAHQASRENNRKQYNH